MFVYSTASFLILSKVSQLSENAISQTPAYRSVAESVKELQEYVETLESDNARQQEELDKLLTGRTSWEAEQKVCNLFVILRFV